MALQLPYPAIRPVPYPTLHPNGRVPLTASQPPPSTAAHTRLYRVSRPRLFIQDELGRVKPAVALASLALLIAAFVVPTTLANIFAVLGLAGLLSFRVSVMQPRRGVAPKRESH